MISLPRSLKVDGDSDSGQVLRELRRCIHREIASLRRERAVESIDEKKDVVGKLQQACVVVMNVSYVVPRNTVEMILVDQAACSKPPIDIKTKVAF